MGWTGSNWRGVLNHRNDAARKEPPRHRLPPFPVSVNLTQDLPESFFTIKVSLCPSKIWPLCSDCREFCGGVGVGGHACLPQPSLPPCAHSTQGAEQLSDRKPLLFTSPRPLLFAHYCHFCLSRAAYQLLDVQSSFCMRIWSRLAIRNQYFR